MSPNQNMQYTKTKGKRLFVFFFNMNILQEIRKRKANWIGHILRRNCLLKEVIERKDKGGDGSGKKTRKKT